MYEFNNAKQLINLTKKHRMSLAQVIIKSNEEILDKDKNSLIQDMAERLEIMAQSIKSGLENSKRSFTDLSGGDAIKLAKTIKQDSLLGKTLHKAITYSFAIMETNARFGKIVAYPTAGSAGTVPATLIAAYEDAKVTEEKLIEAMFISGGIGAIIAENAMISGATGGCQAEVGSACAMAAGALTYMRGGTSEQVFNAAAIALKGLLGLVCDPVAGLVECPCVKRNATAIANAYMASEIVLSGIESNIPFDEVVMAMKEIGLQMSEKLKETAEGGVANTPTGQRVMKKILEDREK